jgi:outer membrane protein assembly factor BamB
MTMHRTRLHAPSLILLASIATAPLASTARGEDWPQFRGPTGEGLSAARGLPVEWSDTKNVAWKRDIDGHGWSSPVVVRGKIYLTTAVTLDASGGPKLSLRTLCLEADTGKPAWNVEVFSRAAAALPPIHSKNGHASPTPLVDGGRLYVHFGHLGTACLDLAGKVVWRNDTLHYSPVHGGGGSPVLIDGRLIFSCDGGSDPFVVALDSRTGRMLWKTPRPGDSVKKFAFSTPLVIEVAGRKQVVSPGAGSVGAFDPATGREVWRVRYDGYSVIPRPVFGHGLVFISTGYDAPAAMAIRPDGHGDVTDTHVVWTLRQAAPNTPSMLLVGSDLWMVADRGVASCVDAKTGGVHWQHRVPGTYSASPIVADGKVFLQSEQGTGVVLAAGRDFKQLAENPLGQRSLASVAVVDGALLVRTEKHLWRIQSPPLPAPADRR